MAGYKKRYNKRRSNKIYKKKKGGFSLTGTRTTMVRPDRMTIRMPFTYLYTPQVGSGGFTKAIRLNSVYDPDPAINTTSAMGWNKWGGFYEKYRVYAVGAEITVANAGDSPIHLAIIPSQINITTATTYQQASEQPRSIRAIVGGSSGNSIYKRKLFFKLPGIRGQTDMEYKADDKNMALWGENPTTTLYLNLYAIDSQNINHNVTFNIRLVYYVEMFSPLLSTLTDVPANLVAQELITDTPK